MANVPSVPIACMNIGSSIGNLSCCYTNDQSAPICETLFPLKDGFLQNGCLTNDCVDDCSELGTLYTSRLQENLTGNGYLPVARYMACANIPSIAGYANHSLLSSNITQAVRQYIVPNTTEASLQDVTSAVTDCLSSTCRSSRNSSFCYDNYCSPVMLLQNNTSPNIEAINNCLYTLCSNPLEALPWADADVIGIGVFSSYIIQSGFIVILWLGFLGFTIDRHKRGEPGRPSKKFEPGKHYKSWIDLLLEFHKSQCYFSATLMIASLTYGIYEIDMLVTFLLTPLATNSLLPVTFAYLLLCYYRKPSMGITLLTLLVYILSTLVYWSLYRHLIPLVDYVDEFDIYQQFMFKLSALPACGGFSGLSICPHNLFQGWIDVNSARYRIRVLTPLIWTYSTFILLALIGYQLYRWCFKRGPNMDSPIWHKAFWLATIVFLAAIVMQIDVLSIAVELNMMNPWDWAFGQIVAVTVWIPPLLEYMYREFEPDKRDEKKHGTGDMHQLSTLKDSETKSEGGMRTEFQLEDSTTGRRNGVKSSSTV